MQKLLLIFKLFKKLLLKRFKIIIEDRQLIQTFSTVDQVRRIKIAAEKSLKEEQVFLDISQNKAWHQRLDSKLEKDLLKQFSYLQKPYMSQWNFKYKQI